MKQEDVNRWVDIRKEKYLNSSADMLQAYAKLCGALHGKLIDVVGEGIMREMAIEMMEKEVEGDMLR